MSIPLDHLHAQVAKEEKIVDSLAEDEAALLDSVRRIEVDLSNTLAEFMATTGRPADEFYDWRRRAKLAHYHKRRALDRKRTALREAKTRLTNAQMLLYATESGYRGEDEGRLLRAMYHLAMEVLAQTQFRLDGHQLGLIAAVRERTEHPMERDVIE